eukprot:scaffold107379_cov68-Phaeocystis_antarctica.AAC.2
MPPSSRYGSLRSLCIRKRERERAVSSMEEIGASESVSRENALMSLRSELGLGLGLGLELGVRVSRRSVSEVRGQRRRRLNASWRSWESGQPVTRHHPRGGMIIRDSGRQGIRQTDERGRSVTQSRRLVLGAGRGLRTTRSRQRPQSRPARGPR